MTSVTTLDRQRTNEEDKPSASGRQARAHAALASDGDLDGDVSPPRRAETRDLSPPRCAQHTSDV